MGKFPKILDVDADINTWSGWTSLDEQATANLENAGVLRIPVAMIENDVLRAYCIYVLAHSHPEFWTCPSSSSGKYHPKSHNEMTEVIPDLLVGGLILHTWYVLCVSFDAMRRYGYSDNLGGKSREEWARTRDELAFASILHDWAKMGDPVSGKWGSHTTKDHGEVAADILSGSMMERFLINFPEIRGQAEEDLRGLVDEAGFAIRHHYGVWSEAKHLPSSNEINDLSRMLQEADYYSTRRYMAPSSSKDMLSILRDHGPENLTGCQTSVTSVRIDDGKKEDEDPYMW